MKTASSISAKARPATARRTARSPCRKLTTSSHDLKTITEVGTFSQVDFTVIGLGEPREIRAGVVDGNYFKVMGLKPVLGRLLGPSDDGPNAPGAVVLTYPFWRNALHSDPNVLGKTLQLGSFEGSRSATIVGVVEPSVPYPVETEFFANVVTSPHHLSATMVQGRTHRMTEIFARLAPTATLDSARSEVRTVYGAMTSAHPGNLHRRRALSRGRLAHARPDQRESKNDPVGAVCRGGIAIHHRLLQRREPDSRAHRAPRIGTGGALRAGRHSVGLAAFVAGRKPRAVRHRSGRRTVDRLADGRHTFALCVAFLRAR